MARKRVRLQIVARPKIGEVLSAPPELETDDPTVDYACGHCGVVLLLAGEPLSLDLKIRCTICKSYNATEG